MKSFARTFLFAAVCLSGLGACQSQGEGEHCDSKNNDSDCETGLTCSSASSMCCVPGTAACNALPVGAAGSGGGSATDAATHDATSETSSTSEAATTEAAASEAGAIEGAANDSARSEASATGNETGVDSSPAGDGAAE